MTTYSLLFTRWAISFGLLAFWLVAPLSLAQETSLYAYPSPSVLWALGFVSLPVIGAFTFVQFLVARGARYR